MIKGLRVVLNLVLAIQVVALAVLITTGGIAFQIAGLDVSMNALAAPLLAFVVVLVVRVGLSVGIGNTLLMLGSTALTLGAGEVVFRILDPPLAGPALVQIHEPSERFGYTLAPNTTGYGPLGEWIEIDGAGRRVGATGDGSGGRIAVLGDSFTFGLGVAYEDSYVGQLGAALEDVEILNYGVIGYHLWHFERLLDELPEVDLVVVGLFMDDVGAPAAPADLVAANPFAAHREDQFTASKLVNVLRNLVTFVETRTRSQRGADYLASLDRRKSFISETNADNVYFRIQKGLLDTETYDEVRAVMTRIHQWSCERGVALLTVLIPDASQLGEPDRQHVNVYLDEVASGLGMAFVDTTPKLEAFDDPRPLYLFPLDAHNSRAGHRVIADAILTHPALEALRP